MPKFYKHKAPGVLHWGLFNFLYYKASAPAEATS